MSLKLFNHYQNFNVAHFLEFYHIFSTVVAFSIFCRTQKSHLKYQLYDGLLTNDVTQSWTILTQPLATYRASKYPSLPSSMNGDVIYGRPLALIEMKTITMCGVVCQVCLREGENGDTILAHLENWPNLIKIWEERKTFHSVVRNIKSFHNKNDFCNQSCQTLLCTKLLLETVYKQLCQKLIINRKKYFSVTWIIFSVSPKEYFRSNKRHLFHQ